MHSIIIVDVSSTNVNSLTLFRPSPMSLCCDLHTFFCISLSFVMISSILVSLSRSSRVPFEGRMLICFHFQHIESIIIWDWTSFFDDGNVEFNSSNLLNHRKTFSSTPQNTGSLSLAHNSQHSSVSFIIFSVSGRIFSSPLSSFFLLLQRPVLSSEYVSLAQQLWVPRASEYFFIFSWVKTFARSTWNSVYSCEVNEIFLISFFFHFPLH